MLLASFILGLLSVATPLRILWIFSSIYFSLWYIGISNLGKKYYVSGEFDKAIEAFKEEISKKPQSAKAYYNLGLAYGKTGQHDKEIVAYEEAVKLNPNRPELHFNLGTVYYDTGNEERAISTLNEAIRLRPDYLKAHYIICKIYSEIGNQENAVKEFKIIKKLDSSVAKELEATINVV
jgi:tetratricopeptide (TPR) repeat protein